MNEAKAKMTGPQLFLRRVMHMRLGRGGYRYGYEILDADEKVIGTKEVYLEKTGAKSVTTYTLGGQEFSSISDFIDAFKAKGVAPK